LSRAHEAGIVHRDLKPDNVFLVVNEDEEVAKVLDFGIAKAQAHALGQDSSTRTGAIMGTAYYMSPEQISGTKNVDYRTDLWAMGVMACECLTGRRPFESETIGGITLKICVEPVPLPSSLAPVPPGFDDWFTKIVHRDPAQRFASARAAADALRQVCTGEAGVQAISGGVPQPSAGHHPTHAGTAGSLSLSRSSHELGTVNVPKRKSLVPWLLAGVLLLALAGGFWLRASRSQVAVATPTSPSAPLTAAAAAAAPPSPPTASLSAPSVAAPQLAASAPTPEIAVSTTPGSTLRADEVASPRPARPGVSVRPTAPPRPAPVVAPAPAKPAETASQSKPVTAPVPPRDLLDSR
jgi:serine/threonine-protein kinase